MKKQINEVKRLQELAGINSEGNKNMIFADFSLNSLNYPERQLGRALSDYIHSLDEYEGVISDLYDSGEMEGFINGDEFYGGLENNLKAFQNLPQTFILRHNIDGNDNEIEYKITKTGDDSWAAKPFNSWDNMKDKYSDYDYSGEDGYDDEEEDY